MPGVTFQTSSGHRGAAFARSIGASWVFSYGIRAKAKRYQATHSFLFMKADGDPLPDITCLTDDGIISPSRGSSLRLRIDQGGHGLRRSRTGQGQVRCLT